MTQIATSSSTSVKALVGTVPPSGLAENEPFHLGFDVDFIMAEF